MSDSTREVFLPAERVASETAAGAVAVDVRDGWEYDGIGHLPGAVSIPFDTFRSADGDRGMLPGADDWAATLSAAGIGTDDRIVAYDDTHGVFAARFLVTAELYGHDPDRLHLLDGDYSAWSRERAVEREATTRAETSYTPREPADSPLVGFETVAEAVETVRAGGDPRDPAADGPVIVDTREAWEYAEGHLPGAVQLDWLELVDADGTRGLRPAEERESVLRDRGIVPDRQVILYCNTARRISHTYLVLRHTGFENVAFYEGSLTEWDRREGELVTGDEPF